MQFTLQIRGSEFSHSTLTHLVNQAPKDIPVGELDASMTSPRKARGLARGHGSATFLAYCIKRPKDEFIGSSDASCGLLAATSIVILTAKSL